MSFLGLEKAICSGISLLLSVRVLENTVSVEIAEIICQSFVEQFRKRTLKYY